MLLAQMTQMMDERINLYVEVQTRTTEKQILTHVQLSESLDKLNSLIILATNESLLCHFQLQSLKG